MFLRSPWLEARSRALARRAARVAVALLVACHAVGAAHGAPPAVSGSRALIVKFASEGDSALLACAEMLFESGLPFASASARHSDSIDRLHRSLRPRRIRALFRRPDGRPLALQRRALAERLRPRTSTRRAGRPARELPDLSHVYRIELAPDAPVGEALAGYRRDPHVVWVQRDHSHRLDALPNDPFLTSSGSWGQGFADLWGLHRIRAPEAWAITQGEGVIVAVVDTGLDYDHPDIARNVWVNPGEDLDGNGRVDDSDWNGVDDDGNGFVDDLRGFDFAGSRDANGDGDYTDPFDLGDPDPFDVRGHGTHVAGTIAAVADNGIGIAGVAPRARIMPLGGFPPEGDGRDSDLWRAVLYAADNGARVVNNSWSCHPPCPRNPLAEEVVAVVHALDVVIVTSAGNRRDDVVFNSPEHLRETITVSSSGQDDRPSESFTNFGWLVDVAAPGGGPSTGGVGVARRNILSLRSSADLESLPFAVGEDARYLRNAGTSMAAPHVAGVVALLRSAHPGLDYESLRRILRQSAQDLGPPGHDRETGAGRLDALAASSHPVLPDLVAAIDSPRQNSTFRPAADAVVEVRGSAVGDDLADFSLHYGSSSDPEVWLPIVEASAEPVTDGVLARWPLGGLAEGAYVLKLDVRGREGSVYSEFLQLSLERNSFVRISSAGPDASRPDVSGELVVWQSRREPAGGAPSQDSNLFATDLSDAGEILVSGAPGDQQDASIAGEVVSWLDARSGLPNAEVFGCQLDRAGRRCAGFPVVREIAVSQPPASARGRIFWSDGSSGVTDLRGCLPLPRAGRCEGYPLELSPWRRGFLGSDGIGLVWVEPALPGFRFGLCEIDGKSGGCAAWTVAAPDVLLSSPAFSGDLLAWVSIDRSGGRPSRAALQLCRVVPGSDACEPIRVAEDVSERKPRLSGNRLVWADGNGTDKDDVFFCDFDPLRQRCPVQRLTAQMARQAAVAVDGDWVVWEDERAGASAIFGIELPSLAPLRDRRLRVGARLQLPVRVRRPSDPAQRAGLALVAEAVAGADLEALGATFVDRGSGSGAFAWRPGPEHVGGHAVTFSATTATGLVARQTIRIEVLPADDRADHGSPGSGS